MTLLWVLHVAWLVLMLATVASFVLGTLAPFGTPTSPFDLSRVCRGGGLLCARTLARGRLSDPSKDETVCIDGKRLKTIRNGKVNEHGSFHSSLLHRLRIAGSCPTSVGAVSARQLVKMPQSFNCRNIGIRTRIPVSISPAADQRR